MSDIMQLSEKAAEEFGQKCADDGSISPHQSFYDGKNGFLAGFQSCLDLLAKQSGEFEFDVEAARKYGRDLFGGARDTIGESYVLQAMRHQYNKDKAALLSANAKIAKLEENNNNLTAGNLEQSKVVIELQQRVKELQGEYERLDKHHLDHAKFCDNLDKERLTMISQLESQLKEAVEVIEFYADKKNYGRMGQIIQWTDTPIGMNKTVDFGSNARSFLTKLKGGS